MCSESLGSVNVCFSVGPTGSIFGCCVGGEVLIERCCSCFFANSFGYNDCLVVSGSSYWCLEIEFFCFFRRRLVGYLCSETEEEKVGANCIGFLLHIVNFS